MKYSLLFILLPVCAQAQSITTECFNERRWLLNSGINLPAAKFHLTEQTIDDDSKGFLELFSSFGVGLSINYGDAKFTQDLDNMSIIEDRTEFTNLIGLQCGVLFSSKVSEIDQTQLNVFALYAGLNVLDLQIGGGREFGSRIENSNGWFLSVSYGIPIYKISGTGSYLFKKSKPVQAKSEMEFAHCGY